MEQIGVPQRLDLRQGLDCRVPDPASAQPQPLESEHGQVGETRADEILVRRLEPAPMVQAEPLQAGPAGEVPKIVIEQSGPVGKELLDLRQRPDDGEDLAV